MAVNFSQLAKKQFQTLMKEFDEDCGAESTEEYTIDDQVFELTVCGFWEKLKYFDWVAKDKEGNRLASGDWVE